MLSTTSSVSPEGAIALVRVQYPAIEHLETTDLANLKDAVADLRDESSLTLETGGDLFFAFEEAPTGLGEVAGIVVAMVVLLIAFGSFVAMGLPIGMALFGLVVGVTSIAGDVPGRHPGVGAAACGHGRARRRHRLRALPGHPAPRAPGPGDAGRGAVGRALATAGQAVIFAGGTVVVAISGCSSRGSRS